MQSYGQYCPISRSAQLLGDRWTIRFGPLNAQEVSLALSAFVR